MTSTTCSKDFGKAFEIRGVRPPSVESRSATPLTSFVRRLRDVFAVRQSPADREMCRLLACSGGRLTDSMEREVMRKALVSDWSLPGSGLFSR
jgi:hypothetical protein